MARRPAEPDTSSQVVDPTTGEIMTREPAANDVTAYLSTSGYNLAVLDQLDRPPAVYLDETPGAMLAMRFRSVAMGPETEYGSAPVIEFTALAGHAVRCKAGPVDIVGGEKYTMHLFSQTLNDLFIDLAPAFDELVVLRYCGTRPSGQRTDKDGNPVEYHLYSAVCPDRTIMSESLAWGELPRKGKSSAASTDR